MSLLKLVPWQVWAALALVLAVGAYGYDQYRRGQSDAALERERANAQAEQKRVKTDDAVRHMDDAELRRALGEWVR